jgi:hypothetical protein
MKQPCEDFFETLLFEAYENGKKVMDLLPVIENEMVYSLTSERVMRE